MPRQKKSITARKRSSSAPAAIHVKVSRSGKHKKWLQESMMAAMKVVEDGMSVYRVSQEYGVPRSTLY